MGFSESDYVYNQSRAHSADMFFIKMKMAAPMTELTMGDLREVAMGKMTGS